MCERWVETDWTDCNILTPSSSVFSSTSFSFCWAAQTLPSAGSWFSLPRAATRTSTATRTPTNWLQLTQTVCGTGLYNCLTSTCFLWASHLHRIQPVHGQGYILISSTGCTCFLIDGWVEGQYVIWRINTLLYKNISLTLYSREGDVCCVWEVSGDKDGLLFWPKFFLAHSSTSSSSWLGLLNRGSLRAQSPLSAAGSHFGFLSPTDSNRLCTWLFYCLTPTCFCCSSTYLHRCISWLTARSRVNI